MNISLVYEFLAKEAENIKNLAIFLPVIWGILFTKDWLSITSFYNFYRINRLCKMELKQLLNLRYIATLIISIVFFFLFNFILMNNKSPIDFIYVGILNVFGFLAEAILHKITEKDLETIQTPYVVENYRKTRISYTFAFRMLVGTFIVFSLLFIYAFIKYGQFDWPYSSNLVYTLYFFSRL